MLSTSDGYLLFKSNTHNKNKDLKSYTTVTTSLQQISNITNSLSTSQMTLTYSTNTGSITHSHINYKSYVRGKMHLFYHSTFKGRQVDIALLYVRCGKIMFSKINLKLTNKHKKIKLYQSENGFKKRSIKKSFLIKKKNESCWYLVGTYGAYVWREEFKSKKKKMITGLYYNPYYHMVTALLYGLYGSCREYLKDETAQLSLAGSGVWVFSGAHTRVCSISDRALIALRGSCTDERRRLGQASQSRRRPHQRSLRY
ncbi:hypothetical protein AGLY_010721 [Aphis glycines]|uniref:Uncharacterized protein n=1 Tax=Aphis glycines TaxID=307491 RepID=A0A6G0TEI9_APHGL|nr:hypothetical protein AGLY_010721 [Aphis glycines]